MVKNLQAENEAQIKFYRGRCRWAFDEIQQIINKKEEGELSIDLDIKYKIFNQVHHDSLKALKFCRRIESLIKELKNRGSK